ncbi:DUF1285 domain-containing protein [Marinivivus vitaminiproducens]|uniref:DUF1285 domain-containing protein n=1 Tax=Marinivivus vitaminiproducens TaxID=3035935 RepID=UPI00279AB0C2|nr:DUF1285 domain-containing protein [Geminicoccaceae bacterium SCSIO 64248]
MTNEAERDQGLRGRQSAQAPAAQAPAAQAPAARGPAQLPRAEAGDCGDLGLAILRDGTWTYRGSPIRRMELVRLFASVLRREGDGSYWMVTPVERGRVPVEDAPFTIVEIRHEGEGPAQAIDMRTNLDDWVALGPEHGLRLDRADADLSIPYVMVRAGLEGRLERAPFYHLVELALPGPRPDVLGVWSRGVFFPLEDGPDESQRA